MTRALQPVAAAILASCYGIHRVVRELAPWRPRAAPRGALLVHGSASTFRTAFAPGLVRPDVFPADFGLAPFLAEADIDVWGIDLRWTKVPLEQTTFEFMQSWNFASHVKDVRVVAKIARLVRALTGSGAGRLFLSGHSLGGDIVYAYANDETQRPAFARDVRGLVPLDINYKLVSPETRSLRDEAAVRYAVFKQQFDSGVFHFALAAQLLPFIELGLTAPGDPSPLVPGFTNLQAATAIFSLTHLFYAPLPPYTPAYHFLAGTFDPVAGAPTGLRFADTTATLELARSLPTRR